MRSAEDSLVDTDIGAVMETINGGTDHVSAADGEQGDFASKPVGDERDVDENGNTR